MNELALQYYLKAKDSYPYDLAEVIESLNYALSYDDEQAEIYCFLALFYADQMRNYDKAFYFFEQALVADVFYTETYYHYAKTLIEYAEFEKAKKLLKHLLTIKGHNMSNILQLKALMNEVNGNYAKAKSKLQKSIKLSIDNEQIAFLKRELQRVKEKMQN